LVSTVEGHVVNATRPVCGAVHENHTSFGIAIMLNAMQLTVVWPSAPVVAVELSNAKLPVPVTTSGVEHESEPSTRGASGGWLATVGWVARVGRVVAEENCAR